MSLLSPWLLKLPVTTVYNTPHAWLSKTLLFHHQTWLSTHNAVQNYINEFPREVCESKHAQSSLRDCLSPETIHLFFATNYPLTLRATTGSFPFTTWLRLYSCVLHKAYSIFVSSAEFLTLDCGSRTSWGPLRVLGLSLWLLGFCRLFLFLFDWFLLDAIFRSLEQRRKYLLQTPRDKMHRA